MAKIKVYKCCICHEKLKDNKPTRLVKQQYSLQGYKQYRTVEHYDFCDKCYEIFSKWLEKHKQ